jgi:hypothetical protein
MKVKSSTIRTTGIPPTEALPKIAASFRLAFTDESLRRSLYGMRSLKLRGSFGWIVLPIS